MDCRSSNRSQSNKNRAIQLSGFLGRQLTFPRALGEEVHAPDIVRLEVQRQ
jgi:hypothetical protein